jgi:hypothetical protein
MALCLTVVFTSGWDAACTAPSRYTRRCSRLQLTLCCLSYVAMVWPVAPVVAPVVCKLGCALCSTGWCAPHTAVGP